MRESILLIAFLGLVVTSLAPEVVSQGSEDSEVYVDVDDSCEVGLKDFQQPGTGGEHKYIGVNDTGYFTGDVVNSGNKEANVTLNLTVTEHENRTLELPENESDYNYTMPPYDKQPDNVTYEFSIPENSTLPYYSNENETALETFAKEFYAVYSIKNNYTARVNGNYSCENSTKSFSAAGTFEIVDLSGEGVIPDAIGETDDEVNQEVDTDAELPDNATTEFETDANETLEDADTREGSDENFPGETQVPEPEPEPEPDPIPLLSVDIKPQNSTYTTAKGRFAEIGLNITNTGEEALNNLQLEPRFSEDMDWQAQDSTIDSLGVDETVNQSVYVNAGESVESGIYQIPVYASNDENDIGSQYVNVEVTEEVFTSALNIGEAPRDIQFEAGQNYSVPVLLENDGDSSLEDVQVELQNSENCGEYSSETVEEVPAGESSSININFETSSELNECEATLVASTDSGEFAFSDMNIENVEDVGVVPQQFRFPIVASMWTLMLMAYAVLTKRYGVHNLTVKVPLVLLVVGEALILIYLSSVYYNVLPPGLLPFS